MSERRSEKRKMGLGRGLDALLGDVRQDRSASAVSDGGGSQLSSEANQIRQIAVSDISPHPHQPRRHFAEDALSELANNIAERGIIQPLVLRRDRGGYQIVAGERRWRAAQKAGLHEVPAIIRDFSESETLEIALIENIQREDLNPVEEARAYRRLLEEFEHSQAEIARLVDKSRSHVANLMRLLELPEPVLALVIDGRIQMGHARALINHEDAVALAQKAAEEGLSVREVERLASGRAKNDNSQPRSSKGQSQHSADIVALENELSELLGLKVQISIDSNERGELRIAYRSLEQLDMLCQRLSGESF